MRFAGEKLKALRLSRKWDQHRLAEAARSHGTGITQSQVSRYENGQEPSATNALALAAALDVDLRDLCASEDDDDEEAALSPVTRERELLEALYAALGDALGKNPKGRAAA